MHVIEFIKVACYVVIFGFLWRTLAGRMADNSIGKAMAAIY
jgi:hypothetical protein